MKFPAKNESESLKASRRLHSASESEYQDLYLVHQNNVFLELRLLKYPSRPTTSTHLHAHNSDHVVALFGEYIFKTAEQKSRFQSYLYDIVFPFRFEYYISCITLIRTRHAISPVVLDYTIAKTRTLYIYCGSVEHCIQMSSSN